MNDSDMNNLSNVDLDALPFGAIKLDSAGTILFYNKAEGALAGRDPLDVCGRNFFTEVAPCTNVLDFAGLYRKGVEQGELIEKFNYRFDFKMEPILVSITLMYSAVQQAGWVLVRKLKDLK
jgi:photoactive yellow protein